MEIFEERHPFSLDPNILAEMYYDDGTKDAEFNGGHHAFCFVDDFSIVLTYHERDGHYGIVGGGREPGESLEQTLRREVEEEINAELLSWGRGFAIHSARKDDPNFSEWGFQGWANVRLMGDSDTIEDVGGDVGKRVVVPIADVPRLLKWTNIERRLAEIVRLRSK